MPAKKRSAQRVEEALAKFKRTLDDLKATTSTEHTWTAP
jgi:hypothetical protein